MASENKEVVELSNRLYAANLKWEITDEKLREIFSKFGKIQEARVVRDRFRNRSKGYGFVTYETEDEAKKAVDGLNNQEVEGRAIRLEFARSTGPRPPAPEDGTAVDGGDGAPRGRGGFRGRGRGRGGFRGRGRGGFRGRGRGGFRGRGRGGFRGRGRGRGGYNGGDGAAEPQETNEHQEEEEHEEADE